MEQMPYIKSSITNVNAVLDGKLQVKVDYIKSIQEALSKGDDRRIYELIDSQKYNETIRKAPHADSNESLAALISDVKFDLSHHLGQQLIDYLSDRFPFFYYEEERLGVFRLYFGNWWDRRQFGFLDPITVRFIFDDGEYDKLVKSVELAQEGTRFHATAIEDTTKANEILQGLVQAQPERNQQRQVLEQKLSSLEERGGFFGGRNQNEEQAQLKQALAKLDAADAKAAEVPAQIEANNAKILEYSKEDTILIYEQRAINDTFGTFTDFQSAVSNLYADYVGQLAKREDEQND